MDNKPWGADGHPKAPYNQPAYGYCTNCGNKFSIESLQEWGSDILCPECLNDIEELNKLEDNLNV